MVEGGRKTERRREREEGRGSEGGGWREREEEGGRGRKREGEREKEREGKEGKRREHNIKCGVTPISVAIIMRTYLLKSRSLKVKTVIK